LPDIRPIEQLKLKLPGVPKKTAGTIFPLRLQIEINLAVVRKNFHHFHRGSGNRHLQGTQRLHSKGI
jgi:hypothetical protein